MKKITNNENVIAGKGSVPMAIYARTAVDDIQKINDQIKSCKEFISSEGWSMANVAVYADNGFSGSNDQRPDFQQMLCDIDSGLYHILVVSNLDRLSRNSSLSQKIIEKLMQKKIQVFIVSGNLMLSNQIHPYHFSDLLAQISG